MSPMQKPAHSQLLAMPDFAQKLIQFSPDSEGGSPGSPADSGDDGHQNDDPPQDANGGGEEQTFSKADVKRISGEVRGKARQATNNKFLEKFKVKSIEELERMVADWRERDNADLTELEIAQNRIGELEPIATGHEETQASLEQYKTVVTERVTALIKDLKVPKYVITLLESKSPIEQLQYLNDNRKAFSTSPKGMPNINGNDGGDGGKTNTEEKSKEVRGKYGIRG